MSEVSGSPDANEVRATVLVVSFSHLVADARVLRQIRDLQQFYDVHTAGYGPAPGGVSEHTQIPDEVIAWRLSRPLLIARQYQRVYDTAPAVAYLRQHLKPGSWDVIVANDVDTVPMAITLAPRAGVHADLHEYASRQNEESRRWRWFVAPYRKWMLRRWVRRADSVTTVGAVIAAEYQREFGIEAGVVTNAAPYAELSPTPVQTPLRLVHSGAARRNRSLGMMIEAVRQTSRDVTLDLYLVPNDPAYLEELKRDTTDLPSVRFRDPVAPADLPRVLNDADVGVFVLPPLTFNYLNTLPNKFFDFVQARLALIVGPSPEMAGLVREHDLGVVTSDFDAVTLAAALDDFDDDAVAAAKRASDAVAQDLSAEHQLRVWRDSVEALLRHAGEGNGSAG